MESLSSSPTPLTDFGRLAGHLGWYADERPVFEALYVSSGADTKAITFLHPDFLERQFGRQVECPTAFVFVDKDDPEDEPLTFDDGRTRIEAVEQVPVEVHGMPAQAQRIQLTSREMADHRVGVLRIRGTNEAVAQAAIGEGWRPHTFIGVCDGCGGYGKNDRCENEFHDPALSIPIRLGCFWWVTDHTWPLEVHGGSDPQNGDVLHSGNPEFPATLTQTAFLSTKWRSNVYGDTAGRMRGGARIFQVDPTKAEGSDSRRAAQRMIYTPEMNRKLRYG